MKTDRQIISQKIKECEAFYALQKRLFTQGCENNQLLALAMGNLNNVHKHALNCDCRDLIEST